MTVWYFVFFRSFVNEELAVPCVCSDKKLPVIFQPVPAGVEAGLEKVLAAGRVSPPGSSDPVDLCLSGSPVSSCGKCLLGFFWLWSWCCFRLAFTIRVILCLAELLLAWMLGFCLVWFWFSCHFKCSRFSRNYVFRFRLWMASEHKHLKIENSNLSCPNGVTAWTIHISSHQTAFPNGDVTSSRSSSKHLDITACFTNGCMFHT